RMPTFDEFIEHSNGRDLLEFFRDYVDDNGRPKEAAAEPDDEDSKLSEPKIAGEPPLPPAAAAPVLEPAQAPLAMERAAREKREQEYRAKHGLSAEGPP